MNKEELFYEAESKTARPHKYSIRYKHKEDIVYPSMVIRSQVETIELQEKEIDRLNNVINELEKYIRNYINLMVNNPDIIEQGQLDILYEVLDKLKELKENNNE